MKPVLRVPKFGSRGYTFLIVLLSLTVFVFLSGGDCNGGGGGSSGCGGSTGSDYTAPSESDAPPISAASKTLNPQSNYPPGSKVELLLAGTLPDGQGNIVWYPPKGASNFIFPAGQQPEPGGPPFTFRNLTAAKMQAGVPVSYSAPQANNPSGTFHDSVTVLQGDWKLEATIMHPQSPASALAAQPLAGTSAPQGGTSAPQGGTSAPGAAVPTWHLESYEDFDSPITQQTCQDMAAQGKSSNVFMVYRLPVADALLPNVAYTLPLVSSALETPKMVMQVSMLQIEMPLEIRLDATAWANENLPAAPGELWVALAVKPDAAVSCPVMNQAQFTMKTDIKVDLSNRPGYCQNCSLAAYACYRAAASADMLDAYQGANGVQALAYGDFICLGPSSLKLVTGANWFFEAFTSSLVLQPGDTIHVHYFIQNQSTSPQTFTLTPSYNLPGTVWIIRPGLVGNPWEPDMTRVVTSPVTVAGGDMFHLHIFSQVPAGTATGQYDYNLTVSSATADPPTWTANSVLAVTATGTLPGGALDGVSVVGAASPSPTAAGQPLTYTFTVTNTGAEPLTGLTLTDPLPAHTAYVSCAGGSPACSFAGGQVTWQLASLDVGQQQLFTLNVTTAAGLPKGTLITNAGYTVTAYGQGVSDSGAPVVVSAGVLDFRSFYLPAARR